MISLQQVDEQLAQVGCSFKLWGRSEVHELANVLMPEERVAQAANGSYEGGFALLCVTNYRVLLIDRKPMMLTIEDIRYDMMAEVDYSNHLIGASVRIFTPMRNLEFNSWSGLRLRKCVNYIQQRVMELRHHGMVAPEQMQTQVNGVSSLPGLDSLRSQNEQGAEQYRHPYSQTPMLTKRRRFPSFY